MTSGSWECKIGSSTQSTNGKPIFRGPIIRKFADEPILGSFWANFRAIKAKKP